MILAGEGGISIFARRAIKSEFCPALTSQTRGEGRRREELNMSFLFLRKHEQGAHSFTGSRAPGVPQGGGESTGLFLTGPEEEI